MYIDIYIYIFIYITFTAFALFGHMVCPESQCNETLNKRAYRQHNANVMQVFVCFWYKNSETANKVRPNMI